MAIKLEDCTPISSIEYSKLNNPRFEGQTRVDENNNYWMVFSCEGTMYKLFGTL